MTHQLISETNDWALEHDEQDIRGRPLLDDRGDEVGIVEDMVVDTATKTVDHLVLRGGRQVPTRDVRLSDGDVRLAGAPGAPATGGTAREPDNVTTGLGPWRIERLEERLHAATRRQQVGEVRLDKRVVEEQRTLDVPVTREQVEVRRISTDRPADGATIGDAEVVVPVVAEQVEVHKETRLVEELEVARTARTATERVSGTVRRQEVEIHPEGDVIVRDE